MLEESMLLEIKEGNQRRFDEEGKDIKREERNHFMELGERT